MKKTKILRWKQGILEEMGDIVAEESLIHVNIGKVGFDDATAQTTKVSFDAAITPEQIRPFVFGYLKTEGFINSASDVLVYSECPQTEEIKIDIKLKELPEVALQRNYNIIWSECGSGSEWFAKELEPIRRKDKDKLVSAADLIKIPDIIKDEIEGFKLTGAYHYAFLFDSKCQLLAKAKDIGRHNAVDKVIGEELLRNSPSFEDCILFMTGRITADIALKCIRCRIPLVASRAAALYKAIELARRYRLGVVGFLRGPRFNVYSGERLINL